MNYKKTLLELAKFGIDAVKPENFISRCIKVVNNTIFFFDWKGNEVLEVKGDEFKSLHLFAVGKASVGMFSETLNVLGDRFHISDGVVVTNEVVSDVKGYQVITSSHPIPDERSLFAAGEVLKRFQNMDEDDFFIFLLSGGGSALLELPMEPITLEDLKVATKLFLESGMDIFELNTLRKHLSKVKGGRLAKSTKARGIVLVLSDVIGDNLEFISSGLLYCDSTSYSDVKGILEKYSLWKRIPENVEMVFKKGILGEIEDTPKVENERIKNVIVSNNGFALRKIEERCKDVGIYGRIITSTLRGEAREVGKVLVAMAEGILSGIYSGNIKKPACLIFGGETTVTVSGNGFGGRNQELVLSALGEIRDKKGITVLSVGSDGIDGKSDAAGGVVDWENYIAAVDKKLNIVDFLKNNDSNTFLKKVGGEIVLGKTGTNVCDIILILIN